MRIVCHVVPQAKSNKVTQIKEHVFRVATTAPSVDNKANLAVTKLMAEHFGVKKSDVFLTAGQTSRKKVFDILVQGTL